MGQTEQSGGAREAASLGRLGSGAGSEPRTDRPGMPSGYGITPADAATMIHWQTVVERLVSARSYWVCTTRPGGRPHVAPVWALWLDGALYFSTDPASRKARNLAASPDLVVHLESGDDVVILEGTAETVDDAATVRRMLEAYAAKYAISQADLESLPSVTYRLRPRVAFAWLEASFPDTATRFRF